MLLVFQNDSGGFDVSFDGGFGGCMRNCAGYWVLDNQFAGSVQSVYQKRGRD